MNEVKFTQGPWRIYDKREIYNSDYDYAIDSDAGYVCQIENCKLDEQEANAHLIAAAPDMYTLLEYLADFIENGGNEGEMETINLDCIKALLKKARGEK